MGSLILKAMTDRLTPIVLWWFYIGLAARHTTWLDDGPAVVHLAVALALAIAAAATDLLITAVMYNRAIKKEQEQARNENDSNGQGNSAKDF